MSNSGYLYEVAEGVFDLITQYKNELGISDTWYGDQALYPKQPAVAVEPVTLDRALSGAGAGGSVENSFHLFIMVFHGQLEDVQKNRRDADKMVADIEQLLHKNLQLNGLVIQGFVTKVESGQAARGSLLAVTRMTWEGISKTLLGV